MKHSDAPVIIRKRVVAGSGHHGGAWKVAYADFVTAMMSLFIVLWLLNSSEQVKKEVSGYFLDPSGKSRLKGSAVAGSGESLSLHNRELDRLKEKIESSLAQAPDLKGLKNQIAITVTGEGLRIELLENDRGTFFDNGKAQPTELARKTIGIVATELGKLANHLLIEGHTDARPFSDQADYGNWELSADRANAARRLMQVDGIPAARIGQVRGFADQSLRLRNDPLNAANRRISLIVQFEHPEDAKEGGEATKLASEAGRLAANVSKSVTAPAPAPAHPGAAKPATSSSSAR